MITEFVNGYNVTGNHGTGSERRYHVCDAAGKVLIRSAVGKVHAMAIAAARPPGDVPDPEAVRKAAAVLAAAMPLKVVTPPPQKTAAKPKTAKPKGAT